MEAGLRQAGLEQFDGTAARVSAWICLPPAPLTMSLRKWTPSWRSTATGAGKIGNLKQEPVPSTPAAPWCRQTWTARHQRLSAWCAEYETEVTSGQHGKCRGWVHLFAKVQMPVVEGDRGIYIVDDMDER
jgi:hypothetical protein